MRIVLLKCDADHPRDEDSAVDAFGVAIEVTVLPSETRYLERQCGR